MMNVYCVLFKDVQDVRVYKNVKSVINLRTTSWKMENVKNAYLKDVFIVKVLYYAKHVLLKRTTS